MHRCSEPPIYVAIRILPALVPLSRRSNRRRTDRAGQVESSGCLGMIADPSRGTILILSGKNPRRYLDYRYGRKDCLR